MTEARDQARQGLTAGTAAYLFWGVMPLYWRQLHAVAPLEILAHRAFWGLGAFAGLAVLGRALPQVRDAVADSRTLKLLILSGLLIGGNWLTFIVAVESDRLVQASLGYFIGPLMNVAVGTLALRERLRREQGIAVGLAALGVAQMAWRLGGLPWIALVLAVSFSIYGLVRKLARVEALAGSVIETAVLAPFAGGWLLWLATQGQGALGHSPVWTQAMLVGTGLVTALPLIWFTMAARRLPLSTLAMIQFISPSVQLGLAVLAFGEPLVRADLYAFGCIWAGLVVFVVDLWRQRS